MSKLNYCLEITLPGFDDHFPHPIDHWGSEAELVNGKTVCRWYFPNKETAESNQNRALHPGTEYLEAYRERMAAYKITAEIKQISLDQVPINKFKFEDYASLALACRTVFEMVNGQAEPNIDPSKLDDDPNVFEYMGTYDLTLIEKLLSNLDYVKIVMFAGYCCYDSKLNEQAFKDLPPEYGVVNHFLSYFYEHNLGN